MTPLAITAAFAVFPNGGLAVRPRDIARVRDADGSTAFEQRVESERVIAPEVAFQMVSMLQRRDRSRHRRRRARSSAFASRSAARPARPTNSRMPGSSASLRRSSSACGWASTSRRPIGADAYGSRYALADLGRLHAARRAHPAAPKSSSARRGLHEEALCAISYRKPVDGCPLYTEYFKEGDDIPGRLCTLHRGSIRQRVTRTIQGWAAEAGRRVRGIFR